MSASSSCPAAAPYPHPSSVAVLRSIASSWPSCVDAYQRSGDVGVLFDQLKALAKRTAPDVAQDGRRSPSATCPKSSSRSTSGSSPTRRTTRRRWSCWPTPTGSPAAVPTPSSSSPSRAKEIDPNNRGAWHLWALTQADLRKRVERWLEVTKRFPGDQLARAALADNATSLANDEQDPVALKLAIATYEGLLAESKQTAQRLAIEESSQGAAKVEALRLA